MSLAGGFLTPEQIRLLADGIEPVLVLNIPPAAETLIHGGLLVSSDGSCDQLSRHILAVTERGRSYVTARLGRQERFPLGEDGSREVEWGCGDAAAVDQTILL